MGQNEARGQGRVTGEVSEPNGTARERRRGGLLQNEPSGEGGYRGGASRDCRIPAAPGDGGRRWSAEDPIAMAWRVRWRLERAARTVAAVWGCPLGGGESGAWENEKKSSP
jgi:hypothetical protein